MAHAKVFDAFFVKADVDRDGRISGVEAVDFFRAAALPQATLAKIWDFADQGQTGFLSRQEFYNALKLATVAQTGRELTPELVKAALTGPVAAQIPPPRMTPTPPASNFEGTSAPQTSQSTLMQGIHGQHFSAQGATAQDLGTQAGLSTSRLSSQGGNVAEMDHFQDRVSFVSSAPWGATWPSLTISSVSSETHLSSSMDLSVESGESQQTSVTCLPTANALKIATDPTSTTPNAANAPNFRGTQFTRPCNAGPLKSNFNFEPHAFGESLRTDPVSSSSIGSLGLPQTPSSLSMTSNSECGYDGRPVTAATALTSPWPRMTPHDIQRFVYVFSQVDTDQDGKITGEQTRELFLSWQFPREVLRHVWNLSDQDGDSMLSVREFCSAVYLLEKYREGHPLPARLPTGIHLDEAPPSDREVPAPEYPGYGGSSWRQPQEPGPAPECSALPTTPAGHLQDPQSAGGRGALESTGCVPYNPQPPHVDTNFINQSKEPEEALTPVLTESDDKRVKQVADLNKHMMSQKEKAEYYRSKLQEIAFFKSRCDSNLAEMKEAVAGKHEVDSLNQQCEEMSKSASEVEAQIAAEVATLQCIQEKKTELSRSLLSLDNGSTVPDSYLQTQLDLTAVDLDKLRKTLIKRAESLGVEIKQELPKEASFGWQPNIQEKSAEWKKAWDNLNDEGFIEILEYLTTTPEVSVLATAASGNTEGEDALELDLDNCGIHRVPPGEDSSVLFSATAATDSETTSGASTGKLTNLSAYDVSKSKNEALTGNAAQTPSSNVSKFIAEASTRDSVENHPSNILEHTTEDLTTGVNTSAHNVPPSISYSEAESTLTTLTSAVKASERYANVIASHEYSSDLMDGPSAVSSPTSSSEVGSSITPDAFGGNEAVWKVGQNDDGADSAPQASWRLQSTSPSIQTLADIKDSCGAIRFDESIGSFEPGDYFDLTSPRDLSIDPQTRASSTMTSEQNKNQKSLDHNLFEPGFGFQATLEEPSKLSPLFAPSTTKLAGIPLSTDGAHLSEEHELTARTFLRFNSLDESGNAAASPSASDANNYIASG